MVAEVLIYVPSIANFRLNWLNDRLAAAHTAALVLDAAPSGMVPESLAKQILDSIGARAVAMKMGNAAPAAGGRRTCRRKSTKTSTCATCRWWRAIIEAFDTLLFTKPGDVMRVVGPAPMGGEFLEIVLDEAPLRKAMWRFSVNILLLSLVISGITATLVFFALHYLLVRPMARITDNMIAFRADPENPARIIARIGPRRRDRRARKKSSPPCSASSPRCCIRRAGWPRSASRCRRSITICAICWRRRSCSPTSLSTLARSQGAALCAQADARARARHRVLPVDAVLRRGAGAAARAQDRRRSSR